MTIIRNQFTRRIWDHHRSLPTCGALFV